MSKFNIQCSSSATTNKQEINQQHMYSDMQKHPSSAFQKIGGDLNIQLRALIFPIGGKAENLLMKGFQLFESLCIFPNL